LSAIDMVFSLGVPGLWGELGLPARS
jgi:hypothetical protein